MIDERGKNLEAIGHDQSRYYPGICLVGGGGCGGPQITSVRIVGVPIGIGTSTSWSISAPLVKLYISVFVNTSNALSSKLPSLTPFLCSWASLLFPVVFLHSLTPSIVFVTSYPSYRIGLIDVSFLVLTWAYFCCNNNDDFSYIACRHKAMCDFIIPPLNRCSIFICRE